MAGKRSRRKGIRSITSVVFGVFVAVVASYYGLCTLLLALYSFIPPPVTGVQLQRGVEYLLADGSIPYIYNPVRSDAISDHLRHAAVAAEDGRFFEHFGIDWQAVREAVEDNRERGEAYRGGSTITQQLVKNLFMTTHSSFVRKAFEVPLTYLAELILTKDRILTLYLNVIEWDRGIYGAEAASHRYFGTSADGLGRYQAASLAAVIPSPRERSPGRMGWYTDIILQRMAQMGY